MFNFPEIKEIYTYRYYDVMISNGEFYQKNKMDALKYISTDDCNIFDRMYLS
jgi:hypothetical protein